MMRRRLEGEVGSVHTESKLERMLRESDYATRRGATGEYDPYPRMVAGKPKMTFVPTDRPEFRTVNLDSRMIPKQLRLNRSIQHREKDRKYAEAQAVSAFSKRLPGSIADIIFDYLHDVPTSGSGEFSSTVFTVPELAGVNVIAGDVGFAGTFFPEGEMYTLDGQVGFGYSDERIGTKPNQLFVFVFATDREPIQSWRLEHELYVGRRGEVTLEEYVANLIKRNPDGVSKELRKFLRFYRIVKNSKGLK